MQVRYLVDLLHRIDVKSDDADRDVGVHLGITNSDGGRSRYEFQSVCRAGTPPMRHRGMPARLQRYAQHYGQTGLDRGTAGNRSGMPALQK